MRTIILFAMTSLCLSACAQNPQQAAAMQRLGATLLQGQPNHSAYASQPYMYNPATGATQKCFHVTAAGTCAHYGAPIGGL